MKQRKFLFDLLLIWHICLASTVDVQEASGNATQFADKDEFDYDLVGNPYVDERGMLCQDKNEMVEVTKFDKQIQCNVSMEEKCEVMNDACHTMYKKKCRTTYRPHMTKVNVRVCPGGKVNVIEREEKANSVVIDVRPTPKPRRGKYSRSAKCVKGKRIVCVTKYETECSTEHIKQEIEEDRPRCSVQMVKKCHDGDKCDWMPAMRCRIEKSMVVKTRPETKCRRVPRQFCRKEECRKGRKQSSTCYYRTQVVNEVIPEEQCNYVPQRVCHEVSGKEESKTNQQQQANMKCKKHPVQKCHMKKINPRPVLKKMKKKVCKPFRSEKPSTGEI